MCMAVKRLRVIEQLQVQTCTDVSINLALAMTMTMTLVMDYGDALQGTKVKVLKDKGECRASPTWRARTCFKVQAKLQGSELIFRVPTIGH